MSKYMSIACILLVLVCTSLVGTIDHLNDDRTRLENNQKAILEKAKIYKTELGKSAASVQMLELTKSELEQTNYHLCKVVDDLRLKLDRVQSASEAATNTKVQIKTVVRDSLVIRDSVVYKIKHFSWNDPWVNVFGMMYPDRKVDLTVESTDTLYQVVHRIPKRFLWFKYGTKAIKQEITSSNPHSKIVYSEYVQVKR